MANQSSQRGLEVYDVRLCSFEANFINWWWSDELKLKEERCIQGVC